MRKRRLDAVAVTLGLALGSSVVVLTAAPGCGSVPDIYFVDDDATTDRRLDAGGVDSSSDARAVDSAIPCPAASPSAGAVCCGTVWCVGECGASSCSKCEQAGCATGETCCGKSGNVLCKKQCQ